MYRLIDGRLPHLPRWLGDGIYLDQIDWPYLLLEFRQETHLPETVLAELDGFIQESDLAIERPLLINADLTEDHLLLIKRENQFIPSAAAT